MKINDWIYTPRFCGVRIERIFENREQAWKEGYKEPTHYHKDGYTILGKNIGVNRMTFAGVKE
ncbi:MAG: hypothetical protein Q4E74_09215 [Ruminococcus sp.]|nr:hypothetical protein [Ruminococcus sp.]